MQCGSESRSVAVIRLESHGDLIGARLLRVLHHVHHVGHATRGVRPMGDHLRRHVHELDRASRVVALLEVVLRQDDHPLVEVSQVLEERRLQISERHVSLPFSVGDAAQPVGHLLGRRLLDRGHALVAAGRATRLLGGGSLGLLLALLAGDLAARARSGGALRAEHLRHVLLQGVDLVRDVDGPVLLDVRLVDVDHLDQAVDQRGSGTGRHELGLGRHADDRREVGRLALLARLLDELVDPALGGLGVDLRATRLLQLVQLRLERREVRLELGLLRLRVPQPLATVLGVLHLLQVGSAQTLDLGGELLGRLALVLVVLVFLVVVLLAVLLVLLVFLVLVVLVTRGVPERGEPRRGVGSGPARLELVQSELVRQDSVGVHRSRDARLEEVLAHLWIPHGLLVGTLLPRLNSPALRSWRARARTVLGSFGLLSSNSLSARILEALDSLGRENPRAIDLSASRCTASGKLTSPSRFHAGFHGTSWHRQWGCSGGRTGEAFSSTCFGSQESPPGKSWPVFTRRPAYLVQRVQASFSVTAGSYGALLAVLVACMTLVTLVLTEVVMVALARPRPLRTWRSAPRMPRRPRRSMNDGLRSLAAASALSRAAARTAAASSARSTAGTATLAAA